MRMVQNEDEKRASWTLLNRDFYPKSNEKPLKGCEQGQDITRLELLKDRPGCSEKNSLERAQVDIARIGQKIITKEMMEKWTRTMAEKTEKNRDPTVPSCLTECEPND